MTRPRRSPTSDELELVFAKETAVVAVPGAGASMTVVFGTHWPADDPVVLAHPQLFTTDPRCGLVRAEAFGRRLGGLGDG